MQEITDRVSDEELQEVIRTILNTTEINVLTKKSIRVCLRNHFGARLHIKKRKEEIKRIVLE